MISPLFLRSWTLRPFVDHDQSGRSSGRTEERPVVVSSDVLVVQRARTLHDHGLFVLRNRLRRLTGRVVPLTTRTAAGGSGGRTTFPFAGRAPAVAGRLAPGAVLSSVLSFFLGGGSAFSGGLRPGFGGGQAATSGGDHKRLLVEVVVV